MCALGFQHFFQQAVCFLMLATNSQSPFSLGLKLADAGVQVTFWTSGVWGAVISGSFLESTVRQAICKLP